MTTDNKKFLDLNGLTRYNNKVKARFDDVDTDIESEATKRSNSDQNLQSQISGLASGSPLAASSTAEMTDHTRIYVNTTDGDWYYWNGAAWTSGGTYQSAEDSDSVNTLKGAVNNIADDLIEIDNIIYLNPDNFELGSLSVVDNVLETRAYTTRVRSKLDKGISLKRGQQIAVRDSAKTVFRFSGFKYVNGTYTDIAWQQNSFTVPEDGTYYLIISKITEEDVDAVYNYVQKIETRSSTYDDLNVTERSDTMLNLEDLSSYLEQGNIVIGSTPARPAYGASTTRVRTRQNTYMFLREGDIVKFTEAGWQLYVGWFDLSGEWNYSVGWKNDQYVITETGNYCFTFRKSPETTIIVSDLTSKLRIKHGFVLNSEIQLPSELNKRVDYIIKSVAHRGYRRFYPENTIPAFAGAARYGFNAIETDIKWTSDGVAVLLHDASINRTARNADGTEISGTVNISDITYAQALTYDFGIAVDEEFAGTKIPTLEEAVSFCKKAGIDMYLDFAGGTVEEIRGCIDVVKKYDMMKHTSWITAGPTIVNYFSAYDETARVGVICTDVNSTIIDRAVAQKTGKNEVFVDYMYTSTSMTDTLRNSLIENGVGLECYTANLIGDFVENHLDPYVTGVTSEWFTGRDISNYMLNKGKYYIY